MNCKKAEQEKSFNREYELAKKEGDRRFGSPCSHNITKNGICVNCKRKVI